jgi:2-polyprenyl-6-methoxyphenol hydroxylase-like FAD-dependent oxidoreductase
MEKATQRQQHAIVMGGSMAGLTAARVLSDHFEQVTLIERDAFPSLDEQRRGVPQGLHSHGLLAGGARALERLFPLLTRELVADGAIQADIVRDAVWFHGGAALARPTSGLDGLLMSRPFVESRVRRRVAGIQNIQIREASQVECLVMDAARRHVTGVRVMGQELRADLVVDATGRGSKLPQWLEDVGYVRPAEERVEVALSYVTRQFRRRQYCRRCCAHTAGQAWRRNAGAGRRPLDCHIDWAPWRGLARGPGWVP